MISLKNQKTLLNWNESYESFKVRDLIYCPNCNANMTKNETDISGPENGSNLYICEVCGQISLIWFRDKLDWESHICLRHLKKPMIWLSGIIVGFMMAWSLSLWGLL